MKQTELFKKTSKAYGGELLKTRKGRAQGRPISTRNSMHLVLRSSKAKDEWSFCKPRHKKKIQEIVTRFSRKYGIKILSLANVGNHLHLHIKVTHRYGYKPFIRAITAAIAMAVTGASRWKPLKKSIKDRFWDYRPFTRVLQSFREYLNLQDYIEINQFEGLGHDRVSVRLFLAGQKTRKMMGLAP